MPLCVDEGCTAEDEGNSIPYRKTDGTMKTETPGSTHPHEPLQKNFSKRAEFSLVN